MYVCVLSNTVFLLFELQSLDIAPYSGHFMYGFRDECINKYYVNGYDSFGECEYLDISRYHTEITWDLK
jgi:hypothetical protein